MSSPNSLYDPYDTHRDNQGIIEYCNENKINIDEYVTSLEERITKLQLKLAVSIKNVDDIIKIIKNTNI